MRNTTEDNLIDPTQAEYGSDRSSLTMINFEYETTCRKLRALMWSIDKPNHAALLARFGISREKVVRNLESIMEKNGTGLHPERSVDAPRPPEP